VRKQGAISAATDVTVPFHDVDLAGVVWHGHYAKYLENARWARMDHIGFGLDAMIGSGYLWPVVSLQVKHVRAARAQTVQVAVEKETGTLQFASPACLVDRVRASLP
jgi:YbgC/YbaW family acyl-CoA thioester hydrolase